MSKDKNKDMSFSLKTDWNNNSEGVELDIYHDTVCECTVNQACKECHNHKGIDESVWSEIEKHF
jgi:hypothetical protein